MADPVLLKSLLIITLVGAECGLIGVFIFLLNIPFIGVAVAHAAMAGGVWGIVLGLPAKASAFVMSVLSSFFIGPVAEKAKINPNISLSIIFSFMMGLVFLGIGIIGNTGSEVMSFLWGNIFLAGTRDIAIIAVVLAVLAACIIVFYRQYAFILFSRELAASSGINEKAYFYSVLFLTGAVVAVNLNIIGGLMLFSLIITPPAAAYQLTFDLKKFFIISAFAGILSGAGGVIISFAFDWPVSASVVIVSSLIFAAALLFSPKRRAYGG